MKASERVLFVTEGGLVFTKGEGKKQQTGIITKKLVITTEKMYIFKTLSGQMDEFEYRLVNEAKKKALQDNPNNLKPFGKDHTSITGDPQNEMQIRERQPKIIVEEEPMLQEYLKKLKIVQQKKSVKNSVLLLNNTNRTLQIVFFEKSKEAFRFAKAINCANAWMTFVDRAISKKVTVNMKWVHFLQEIIYDENAVTMIDPYEFDDPNQEQQIGLFIYLLDKAQYVYKVQFKFKINSTAGYAYANRFLACDIFIGLRSINLNGCSINDTSLSEVQRGLMKLMGMRELILSKNSLTDRALETFSKLSIQCTELCIFDLTYNELELRKQDYLINLLRSVGQHISIDLAFNKVADQAIDTIEKTILYASDAPISEINLSNNLFTKYGSWRLFVGNLRSAPSRAHMVFILYPIPFHAQIFNEKQIQFPVKRHESDRGAMGTLPGNLSQEINQQTFSKTASMMTMTSQVLQGIKLKRKTHSGKPLPVNSQEVGGVTSMKARLNKMVSDKNTPVEQIRRICKQIDSKPFGYPATALEEINSYIWEKLNEALLIRDHESIQILKESAQLLGLDLAPYKERLLKVEKRKEIFQSKIRQIFNFEINEYTINKELDQMVKEGLRLSIKGPGLNILFYLKYLRDARINSFIKKKYTPLPELEQLKTKNYATFYENSINNKQQYQIPYQLKQQKQINENLYIYYLQANYYILVLIEADEYKRVIALLRSIKTLNQKFVKFFKIIQDRVTFIINQFYNSFLFNNFKISYIELKINCCRLLWQYKNIKKTYSYFNMPNFSKKYKVTAEKFLKLPNKKEFTNKYSIQVYPNIRYEARDYGIYSWKNTFTKYSTAEYQKEVQQLNEYTNEFLQIISTFNVKIGESVVKPLIRIIKFVRNCIFPLENLQEFYLHLICFQENNNKALQFLIRMMPFITFYLRPPEMIQNYVIAFLAKHQYNFTYMPLSVDFRQPEDPQFIDRDWIPKQKHVLPLIQSYGKLTLTLMTFTKIPFQITIMQTQTISELMDMVYLNESLSMFADKLAFWIYKYNKRTKVEITFESEDLVGEIMNNFEEDEEVLYIKRRVFSPFYTLNYRDYGKQLTNSIYYEIKEYYLRGHAYKSFDNQMQIASILGFVSVFDSETKRSSESEFKIYLDNLDKYLDELFPAYFFAERSKKQIIRALRARLNERMVKEQEKNLLVLKRRFIEKFRDQPYYCASNYLLHSLKHARECIISINSLYLCIQTDATKQFVYLQSLVSIQPNERSFSISYHNRDKSELSELSFGCRQKQSVVICMDILSYCIIRLKTPNNFLYLHREMYSQLAKYEVPLSFFDYQTTMNVDFVVKRLHLYKEELSQTVLVDFVKSMESIMKKLEKLELLITREKDFPFHLPNLYVHTYLKRDLYPFKSIRKLDYIEPLGVKKQAQKTEKKLPPPTINVDEMIEQDLKMVDYNNNNNEKYEIQVIKSKEPQKQEIQVTKQLDQAQISIAPLSTNKSKALPEIDPFKEQEPEEIKVVKPRNSNKPLDRNSRRRGNN